MASYCIVMPERKFLCAYVCSEGKFLKTKNFFEFIFGMKALCSVFSALLPLCNYEFKSNQTSGAYSIEINSLGRQKFAVRIRLILQTRVFFGLLSVCLYLST